MSIEGALSIASREIGNITDQISLVSHNIANANTPDYSAEDLSQQSVSVGGVGMGAVNGTVQRAVDQQVQSGLFAQNGNVAALQTQQAALQQVDGASGAVGSGTDIGSLLGALGNVFSALAGSPDNQTQQQQVVAAAQALAGQIKTVSATVAATRQGAQDAVVSGVAALNAGLATLGSLSDRIVVAKAAGLSTADLENQRDAAKDSLSKLISVRFLDQPNGDLLAVSSGGLDLPIRGLTAPFGTGAATLAPGTYAPGGGVPAITLGGRDVTAQMAGGEIGGNIALRDSALPTIQANLDEFAYALTNRFDTQGLTLFSDANGNVPAASGGPAQSGYIGYSGTIQVNPAILTNPALVRDGTHAVAAGAGGASAFTPNSAGGPAGFTAMIVRVLQFALGNQVAPGSAQPPPNMAGLGPSGTLSAGFAAPADLGGLATAVTAAEAQQSAGATAQLSGAQALQTTLQGTLAAGTSVSIDGEMSKMIGLQNAYGANARILAAVQSMWTQLLQTVQ
jgi:flagellar hook-associated protein 1